MITISDLASQFELSRATLLYYEEQGLLSPANRSDNGYRWYGDNEVARLRQIVNFRSFGLTIAAIKMLLENDKTSEQQQILTEQFNQLETQIQTFKQQQLAIVGYLEAPQMIDGQMTKEKWTEIMQASGMNDDDMHNWHREFEKLQPQAHQAFLQSLQINGDEVAAIRAWSRK